MKKAWSKIAAIVIGLVLFLWLTGCSGRQSGAGTTRVGVILPLTGDAAVYGKALKNGIDLALTEATTGAPSKVSLVYEDDQGQPAQAVSAARRLIDVERVPVVIGGAMSSTAEAIIPICSNVGVTLISPTATKPSLTQMGKCFFRLWPSDDYDGQVMAEAAYQKLGLKRVAILYINAAYGVGITDVFRREFSNLGGTIVAADGYEAGARDFRTYLLKVRAAKPDAVFLPGYIAEVSQILKQAKDLGIKTRFLGVNSFYDPKLLEIAGPAALGAVFSYPTYDAVSTDPDIARFVAAYKSKYGSEPDAFADQGYDSLRVLLKALPPNTTTGAAICQALHSVGPFDGPGGSFSFDKNGDVQKKLRLITVRNGRFLPFTE